MPSNDPPQGMPSDGLLELRPSTTTNDVEDDTDTGNDKPVPGRLENRAVELAKSHIVSDRSVSRLSPFNRLEELGALLHNAYEFFVRESEEQGALSGAAEWLLDNFYVVRQELRQVHEDMPPDYYRQLPKLSASSMAGLPRAYVIARELIDYGEGQLDADRMKRFVQAYQSIAPLTMGELWALPTMLRLAVIERLAQTVAHILEVQKRGNLSTQPTEALHFEWTDDVIIANCIISLRSLATQDWKTFFESVSRVDEMLRGDPAGVYALMDFDTRDHYRKVVENLARAIDWEEIEIAQEAIKLAKETQQGDHYSPRAIHVGYYLLDTGRAQLEARLGCVPRWSERLRRWLFGHAMPLYLGAVALSTIVFLLVPVGYVFAVGGSPAQLIGAACLSLLPASSLAIALVHWIVTHMVTPRVLPKLDLSAGIPAEYRTVVVVPALLSNTSIVEFLLQQLELHFLSNPDPNLHFALLTDFTDAPQEHMPGDDALIEQARLGIEALNNKHGQGSLGPFFLFHRGRKWNPAENCWMGWERKRGKLFEFNRLLGGDRETFFSVQTGALESLSQVKYVITLDADTILPRDSARRLIATLAHPLNHAEFDLDGQAVVAGYTVLQPRVEIKPTNVYRSLFTQAFSGDSGVDLYTLAVSDVYQDLFGEGIYVGKGIYDVAAFERSLAGRVPDNALLSHDLFEGIHGRTGLVTDITLFEEYPPNYLTYAHRFHRWARGDWQLLPWLLRYVPHRGEGKIPNDLSVLDHWKIIDNLRRSLLAPALLAWLIAGWLWLPGSDFVWTLGGLAVAASPLVAVIGIGAAQKLRPGVVGSSSLQPQIIRWLLGVAFLPYEALLMVDAIASTLVRLTISRKRLLQWSTVAHTIRLFGKERQLALLWKQMSGAPITALGLILLVGLIHPEALPAAAPLLAVWFVSPQIALWISQPIVRKQTVLTPNENDQLRRLARRTWLYFEQFVGPDDHWLPPDHFQEKPLGVVAHRTSPTNLGLLLLSTVAAYDLGYINPLDMVLRLSATFDGMNQLERYRNQFLNWYDTHSLKPLLPRYVSTVDNGNLAACLLALKQGLLTLLHEPVWRWQRWQGLLDTLGVLVEIVDDLTEMRLAPTSKPLESHLKQLRQEVLAVQDDPAGWAPLLIHLLSDGQQELGQLMLALLEAGSGILDATVMHSLRIWTERVHYHLIDMRTDLEMLLPWLLPLSQPPALFMEARIPPAITSAWRALCDSLPTTPPLNTTAAVCKEGQSRLAELLYLLDHADSHSDQVQGARIWCEHLATELKSAQSVVGGLLAGYQNLGGQAEENFQSMDFSFLFDSQRQVFHLGYDVAAERLDNNHYDLLASEARTASLVAIAKGDVPQSHWLHLDRTLCNADSRRALLSWNGSMFEYLMPSLLLQSYEGTLLDDTCHAVVQRQINYAHQMGVPWGISESSYYRFDAAMNYQYQGFGVPGLGLKRGLSEDIVISPYASLLALSVAPRSVMENIAHLTHQGMLGYAGFYESVDYTASRLPVGHKSAVIQTYMAHHQGMSLLALDNYLQNNVMVRRLHADPRVQSVELLLQEKVPQHTFVESLSEETAGALRQVQSNVELEPWPASAEAPLPQAHFLSNGRYGVLITAAGAGYSTWQEVDLTRWRPDTTLDAWGSWIYVKDRDTKNLWSAAYQPTASSPESQEVRFYADKVEFRRRDHDISMLMEVAVAPADDIEIRRITLTNTSARPRHLTLTSYAEVVLAQQAADRRHPAFNKLFIESEYLSDLNALFFRRRLRSADETTICLMHMLVLEHGVSVTGAFETDRSRFLGRCQTIRNPAALQENGEGLSATTGATLDQIMTLGQDIDLEPHATATIAFLTLAAETRHELMSLAARYRTLPSVDRMFDQARTQSKFELRQLGLGATDIENIQWLLSALLYPHPSLRAPSETLAANSKGQSALWAYGISGDYPILLVRVGGPDELTLVRDIFRAHAYWRSRQIRIDLVILNQQDVGYAQELNGQIHRLITRTNSDDWLNRRGGIFLLNATQMSDADRVLLETTARVILDAESGPLAKQLTGLNERISHLPRFTPTQTGLRIGEPTLPLARPTGLLFDNGKGGFSPDGREYVIYLEPGQQTPAPWINVIANPRFGFLVSETGAGYTWAENSGENRLTPWRNDPVADEPGEALYLRDEETAEIWSPTPLPAGTADPYLIRHGAGYSIFEHHSHGLKQRLRLFAIPDAPVKVIQLRLENMWGHYRRITATYYAEWVLGVNRETTQQYIVLEFDSARQALLARNPYNEEFGTAVAFLAASKELHGLTADRTEFLGRNGDPACPAALERVGLAGAIESGLDPCAALQLHFDLPPGEAQEVFFVLGEGRDREEARGLIERYQDAMQVEAAWQAVGELWDRMLSTVTVETPDPAMDLLLNRWLLYQTLSSRVWGRTGLYQSSGAFGYRDQLQDVLSLLQAAPNLARSHILEAARHQFEEGDVLHWWHPPSGRGVRTRISDDLLWLPFTIAEYVSTTGDETILAEKVPFLKAAPLESEEEERYAWYETAVEDATLFDHARRALDKGTSLGSHGLPLMGTGDWNDGMNRVGRRGKGESVWLGWFLYATLLQFAPLCRRVGDEKQAAKYEQNAHDLLQAVASNAWDGDWYRRAYYDSGIPLGSAASRECQIDSISQSWAVLSGAVENMAGLPASTSGALAETRERLQHAMDAVADRLVQPNDQLLLLLTPPFDGSTSDPGYIKGYPPGIRENGGQYTHAATWVVWAFAELGQGDRAAALFRLLNPIYHGDAADKIMRYRVEPYVLAGDVYSAEPHVGRGGWTWYTGSASWMYRLGLEAILGLSQTGSMLHVTPCIPKKWPSYRITYRDGLTSYEISVENPDGVNRGVKQVSLDGGILEGGKIPLTRDGRRHKVDVLMG